MAAIQDKLATVVVTLTNANTNYNLYDLAVAIRPLFPRRAKSFGIFAPSANVAAVLVGDANLSTTHYGEEIGPSGRWGFIGTQNDIPVENFTARSASAGQKLALTAIIA